MKQLTEMQRKVYNLLKEDGKASILEVANILRIPETAAMAHLSRMDRLGILHVSDWKMTDRGQLMKVYKLGKGVSLTRVQAVALYRSKPKQEQMPDTSHYFDPAKPRADVAAAWLMA